MFFRKLDASNHNALLVIISCGLLLFLGLGTAEIQPWDEALYAIRARAVVEHQAWWDQTSYALGGLYSATYPPLTVWAMALSIKLFGENPFAIRLYGVLCAFASLILFYSIAGRIFARRPVSAPALPTALMAPALLAGTLLWNRYARMGMNDVPLIMYSLLALWAVLKLAETAVSAKRMLWAAVYALACAAALMTKIVVSFLPLCFLLYPLLQRWLPLSLLPSVAAQEPSPSQKIPSSGLGLLSLAALVGIALALPWHLSMASTHGSEFSSAFLTPHLSSVVEGNTRSLGLLYYINQLLVANPFIVLCFVWFAVALRRVITAKGGSLLQRITTHIFSRSKNPALEMLCALWFALLLLILSIAPTKMPYYTLLVLPPALYISLLGFELLTVHYSRSRAAWLGVMLLALCCAWSLSQRLRDDVQLLGHGIMRWDALLFVGVALLMIGSTFVLRAERRLSFFVALQPYIGSVLPLLLVLHVGHTNFRGDDYAVSGGREVTHWLAEETGHRSFVYLYHYHNASDTLIPQLAWYTRDWTCGKQVKKTYYHAAMPLGTINPRTLDSLDAIPLPIIYAAPLNDTLTAKMRILMRHNREEYIASPGYVVFSEPIKKEDER